MRFLFTAQPEAADLALAELRRADPALRVEAWPEPGVGLGLSALPFPELSAAVRGLAPVFLRHLAPAELETALPAGRPSPETAAEIAALALARTGPGRRVSVQIRAAAGVGAEDRWALDAAVCAALAREGRILDRAGAGSIVSVWLGRTALAGVSSPEDNLSSWPGGMRRFARTDGTASRAEFKLLEALELWGGGLPDGGRALDLGAAPGGWTRVLAGRGFSVDAVDPAELDPAVAALPAVTHWRATAQDFLNSPHGVYDLLVNDMKMDAAASAAVTAGCAGLLAPAGLAVMTFKLRPKKWTAQIREGLAVLSGPFEVAAVKQLFHNRSEVTVALRRR